MSKADETLARLEQKERELDDRLAALDKREAAAKKSRRGPEPRSFQPTPEVRELRDAARDYLRGNYYQASSRDLALIESVFHAIQVTGKKKR
jgi:hypothetical protein